MTLHRAVGQPTLERGELVARSATQCGSKAGTSTWESTPVGYLPHCAVLTEAMMYHRSTSHHHTS